jgi:hypothetical protein
MGEIGATEALASRALGDCGVDPRKVTLTGPAAPLNDAVGHLANAGIELGGHASLASLIWQAGCKQPCSAKTRKKKGG